MKFSIALFLTIAVAITGAAQPQQPPGPCFFNVLKNNTFSAGINIVTGSAGSMPPSTVSNWVSAFKDPQIVNLAGCPDPGYVAMWGNQVVGEGIRQTLTASLTQGKKYRFRACVRYANPTVAGPVRFKVRASAGPLAAYATPGQVIGVTGNLGTGWSNITLPDWTAPVAGLNTITINPENQHAVNQPSKVSWGHIDNVCLQPVTAPCVLDPGMVNASNTFARRAVLAQTFTPPNSGGLEAITHGLQKLSGSVTGYQLLITTTTNGGLPAWTGGSTALSNVVLYSGTHGSNPAQWATNGIVNGVVQIPWTNPVWLNAGTRYAIILIPGAPANGVMYWRGNSGASTYPNGSAYELNGATWVVPTTGPKDHGFRLGGVCH